MHYYRCTSCGKIHKIGFWKRLFAVKLSLYPEYLETKCGRCGKYCWHKKIVTK